MKFIKAVFITTFTLTLAACATTEQPVLVQTQTEGYCPWVHGANTCNEVRALSDDVVVTPPVEEPDEGGQGEDHDCHGRCGDDDRDRPRHDRDRPPHGNDDRGHGNGDEGDCRGRGCNDEDNPGRGHGHGRNW